MKTVDFSETIVACELKVGRCRQLIELMKVYGHSRSRSFLALGPRSFLRNLNAFYKQIIYVSFLIHVNENFGRMTKCATMPVYG